MNAKLNPPSRRETPTRPAIPAALGRTVRPEAAEPGVDSSLVDGRYGLVRRPDPRVEADDQDAVVTPRGR